MITFAWVLKEINSRLKFINNVGLGYLTLNRRSSTLSGGESQRINLATSLGSSLVSSLYVLDEPSIGLHPRDTEKLIDILKELKDLGNTVIVVEHDEDIIRCADQIVDIGPEAGSNGGLVVAQGTIKEVLKSNSLTSKYLNNREEITKPNKSRYSAGKIIINGARENNLKNINVGFLGRFDIHIKGLDLLLEAYLRYQKNTNDINILLVKQLNNLNRNILIPTWKFPIQFSANFF